MQKSLRIFALTLVAPVVAGCIFPPQTSAQVKKATARTVSRPRHGISRPQFTGDDGSQTGVAKFEGNYTVITAPPGNVLALSREPDCSLTMLSGSYLYGPPFSYTPTSLQENYERELHTNAGLATTVDAFPAGCVPATTGISRHPGSFVGTTTSGIDVYINIGYDFATGSNALFILTGTATFELTTFSFANADSINVADLNHDGNNDLVIVSNVNGSTGQVYVLLGNSDGTFQTAVPYNTAGNESESAVIDDFNGDGKLDIAVTSQNNVSSNGEISILLGNGDGTFKAAQSFTAPTPVSGSAQTPSVELAPIVSADLRGIGKKDLIASNGLVLLNNGDGTFTPAPTAAFGPLQTFDMAVGDLNRDGKTDLVVSTGGSIFTYLGKGDGTFTPGLSYITIFTDGYIAVSDLDGDGNPDIYVGVSNNGLFSGDSQDTNIAYALMGNGDGSFHGAPTIVGQYAGNNLGDVNGDGQPDLIVNNLTQDNEPGLTFTVELGTSRGTFNPVSTITLPASITVTSSQYVNPVTLMTANGTLAGYAVGDLNGDGKADLALVENIGGVPIYFISLSNGDGTFTTPAGYAFPQIAPSTGYDVDTVAGNVQIADFNHDGKADLIFNFSDVAEPVQTYLQGLAVLPGTGNGTFGAPIFTYTYNSPTQPAANNNPLTVKSIADLNGDGIPDLIVNNDAFAIVNGFGVSTDTVQIYTGKGDGTFNAPTTAVTSNILGQIVIADLNRDGKLDIACLGEAVSTQNNTAQAQLFIALGKGDGTFNAATTLNLSGGDAVRSSGLAAADFDGDGNVDLALIDGLDFSGIYYGKGDGTFTSVPLNGNLIPKDLINIDAFGQSVALDLNKDGRPDMLAGATVLLNLSTAPAVVNQFNTSTTIASSATTVAQGAGITLTATVTPASGSTGTPAGNFTFADGQTIFATVPVGTDGKATYTTSSLGSGPHAFTAAFSGSTNFLGSISSVVNVTVTGSAPGAVATTTSLSTSASSAVAGTSITFTATVTAASGSTIPSGIVTFADAGTTLGTGTLDGTGKATYTTSALAIGSHSITAAYGGAATFSSSTSTALSVTITAASAADFSIALASPTATVASGASSTTTISVTPTGGFNQAVILTCTGAPANSSCTIAPSSVTPSGNTAATATLTFADTAQTASLIAVARNFQLAAILPLGLLGTLTLFFRQRRHPAGSALLIVLLAASALLASTGCGGGHKSTDAPAGTYTLTVTGTSGSATHSTTYAVTVQ